MPDELPQRIINAIAPIRICDTGGWTDTWFAGHGAIFNIAVSPVVEVQIAVYPRSARSGQVTLYAENYAERYLIGGPGVGAMRHPLLEATIAELAPPPDVALEITIYSDAPAGASTGTSAAVTVALIGALDRLTPGDMAPYEVARCAHRVETGRLGLQSGIQDQLSSAFGGINYIEMDAYPEARVTPLALPEPVWWELERRLALVFLGKGHNSSAVHEQVIATLKQELPASSRLEPLRHAAKASRDALLTGDFDGLGQAMRDNTEAQRALHPALICDDAERVIALAQEYGLPGWKVNGAGGEGGSLTLLCDASASHRRSFLRELQARNPHFTAIPITLSRHGLRVWEVLGGAR